jgi:hypothetical protein
LKQSEDPIISETARTLERIVKKNESRLMIGEKRALGKMGIRTAHYFANLIYFEKTCRLSVLWHANTSRMVDAARAAILTMPDDNRKRIKVEKWMKERGDVINPVRNQLKEEGLLFNDRKNEKT